MAGAELVPVEKYAVVQQDTDNLMDVIKQNVGSQSLTEFDLDRVKMPTGGATVWEVPTLEGSEAAKTIDGVIVYWKQARAFWASKEVTGSPPDCSSPDAQFASGDPHADTPVAPNGMFICAQCPQAQWGTAVNDKGEKTRGQACKLVRPLFVLTPQDLLPIVVSLAPTSDGAAGRYFLRLARAGVPYNQVVTRIGLETVKGEQATYSVATFQMAERLDDETAAKMRQYSEEMRPAFEQTVVLAADELGVNGGGGDVAE